MLPHLQTIADQATETAVWMRSDQAAIMAQIDEQTRGEADGLIVGDSNPTLLRQWITTTYGDLPPAPHSDTLSGAAAEAGRVRKWQADRLDASAVVVISGDCATATHTLATSGMFTGTVTPPSFLDHTIVTFAWTANHTACSTSTVITPGGLQAENQCCAITVDTHTQRIIEWSPAPTLSALNQDLSRMVNAANGTLPPWLLSSDTPHTPLSTTVEQARKLLVTAAAESREGEGTTLVEEAGAVATALEAGMFHLRRHTSSTRPLYEVLPPS